MSRVGFLLLSWLLVACGNTSQLVVAGPPELGATALLGTADRLAPDNGSERAYFADSVAVDNDTIVIGAWGDSLQARNAGAAYVYSLVDHEWKFSGRLDPSDPEPELRFGHAVAVDGDTILVGAVYSGSAGFRSGSVYVYSREETVWTMSQRLVPRDASSDMYFGTSVAIHDDTAVIGAAGPTGNAAYVFSRTGTGWTQEAKLDAPTLGALDRFGGGVSVAGATVAVSATVQATETLDQSDELRLAHAYVYEKVAGAWTEVALLKGPEVVAHRTLGPPLALSNDRLVVGSIGMAEGVRAYRYSGRTWTLEQTLEPIGTDRDFFGMSVASASNHLIVGAPGSHDGSGSVYVFDLEQPGNPFSITSENAPADARLGHAVAVGATTIVMGAPGDATTGVASGAAYTLSIPLEE